MKRKYDQAEEKALNNKGWSLTVSVYNNIAVWNQHLVHPGCVDTWAWYLLPTLSLQMCSEEPLSDPFFQAAGEYLAGLLDGNGPLCIKLWWHLSIPIEMSV